MRSTIILLAAFAAGLAGCGAGPNSGCTYSTFLQISPKTATVSSAAKAPANEQQFMAASGLTGSGASCVIPEVEERVFPIWTNPDPVHISISSANDQTNGQAVCLGPTSGPVTLGATLGPGSAASVANAQLTCE